MSYPISKHQRDESYKYCFKVWTDEDKYVSANYTLDGIREMKQHLEADGAVYEIQEVAVDLTVTIINV